MLEHDAIWGLIVGDSMGASSEFGERWMRDMDPVKEMRGGGIFELPVGGWTDDTSMVLATLESLKAGYHPEEIMNEFVKWLRKGKYSFFSYPIGIGKQVLRAIEAYEKCGDIYTCGLNREEDNGNGSLMRILPICLYGYKKQKENQMTQTVALNMIHEASSLTHGHVRSKIACGMYYFIVQCIIENKGSLIDRMQMGINEAFEYYRTNMDLKFCHDIESELALFNRIEDLYQLKNENRDNIKSTGYVIDTLEAALWCLITEDSYKDSILKAVNLGLDTDTIAAIAGGLAGLYYGHEAIPEEWISNIRKKEFIEECLN